MSDNESSLSSPLSSALSFDGLSDAPASPSIMGASRSQSRASTPRRKKRSPSPPHEYVLADNEDIAFIVMFRARFSDAFPQKLIHFGPQDIERGIVDSVPSPQVESLLCALLALVLNRKKPVERGHYGRALEEAISTQKSQWPRSWEGINPLAGSTTFNSMNPQQRLSLIRALIMWSLNTSEIVTSIIKEFYKQTRHDDDRNQPLAVQSWGRDGDKRRYWLVEGKDDTDFRVYRESNPALKSVTWRSVAGSIDELKDLAAKLDADGSQAARRLSTSMTSAIPRFEATEEKRKRREYRLLRKAQFSRPEPGFSNYEGRTRGKRMKYTYSDDEDSYVSDGTAPRRSTRNSNFLSEPTVTASGRQTRTRYGAMYGSADGSTGGNSPVLNGHDSKKDGQHNIYDSEAFNADSSAAEEISSGEEWTGEGGRDVEPEYESDAEMEDVVTDDDDIAPKSLVVTLRYGKGSTHVLPERLNPTPSHTPSRTSPQFDIEDISKNDQDAPKATNQITNGNTNKSEEPATPESEERPKPVPSFANFLYKPSQETKTAPAPRSVTNGTTPLTEDAVNEHHFHAPDISVKALTGHTLAFSAPSS